MNHILITSIGAKIPLIKSVLRAKNAFNNLSKVYGADVNDNCLGKHFVDEFWMIPYLENLTSDIVLQYCKNNHIKYIIPTRDEDVLFFSKIKTQLLKNNIYIFTSSQKSIELCFDKYYFASHNQQTSNIPTALDINKIHNTTHYVVKERFGSGSKNIGINLNYDDATAFSKSLQNPIFQPYLKGIEYSVDSYITKENKCIDCIVRRREKVLDGEAVVTTNEPNLLLEQLTKEFLLNNKIQGHSVTQFIQVNDEYYLLECNTRFGGASTLSEKLGLRSFYWFLCETNTIPIEYTKSSKIITQIRHHKDSYFEH